MTAVRRSHEDESNHPSQIGAPGRSAGEADRGDPVFQPNTGVRFRNLSGQLGTVQLEIAR